MSQTKLIINSNGYRTVHILESFNKDAITFGRDPRCDIVINNQKVSNYHGYIYRYNGKWYIKDHESANGILINNVKVTESELRSGAKITLDKYIAPDSVMMDFVVEVQSAAYQGAANSGYQAGQNAGMRYQNSQTPGAGYQNNQGSGMRYQSNQINQTPGVGYQNNDMRAKAAEKKEQEAQKRKGNIGLALGITSLVLVVILMVVVGIYIFGKDDDDKKAEVTTESTTVAMTTEMTTEAETEATTEASTEEGGKLTGEEIFDRVNPSTVEIIAVVSDQYASLGTGFYIDNDGTIATNYHVIDQAKSAIIKGSDGTEYEVVGVRGYDPDMDLAILSTSASGTTPLERTTDEVKTGEKVYALGNSQGYQSTFTEGIVSMASREEKGHTYIQHSAPITNGNSGGPLLDEEGKVLGINTWVRTDGQNLNFAIPIAEIDNISIDGNLSLEQVYENVYGTSSYEPTYTVSDWENITIAEEGSKSITIKAPKDSKVTDDNGNKTVDYMVGNGGINVSGELQLGNYSNVTDDTLEQLDDEIINEVAGRIDTLFDGDYSTSVEGSSINGRNWRVYTFSGLSNSYDTDVYLMITCDNDAVACVYMVSMSQNDDEEIRQKVIDILSSVELY